jgi:hypothetical protein
MANVRNGFFSRLTNLDALADEGARIDDLTYIFPYGNIATWQL